MGLLSRVIEVVDPYDSQEGLSHQLIECLGTAVRKGYDAPEKVFFAGDHAAVRCRVQVYWLWAQQSANP